MSTARRLRTRRILQKLLQDPERPAANRWHKPRLEPLEPRLLLTVAPLGGDVELLDPYENLSGPTGVLGEEAIALQWEGADVYARRAEWIVQFEGIEGTVQEQMEAIQQRLDSADFSDFGMSSPREHGAKVVDHLGADGLVVVSANEEQLTFEQLYEPLLAIGGVEFVEPNFVDLEQASTFPNDRLFSSLYGLHNTGQTGGYNDADIDAPEAWGIRTGSRDVVVAVIDTGIDYNHPDLAANMWTNPGEIADNGVDDDGNGYVDDVYGYDFAYNDSDPWDDNSHGTHVAGTIGAIGDNGTGVTGVNWDVQLMALKFLNRYGRGWTSNAVKAVNYASMMKRDYGVNVVLTSNSWGGGGNSTALRNAIADSGDQNMLFVAAAGNDGRNTDLWQHYPSGYDLDNIISVAATDSRDNKPYFSNYGLNSVDLGAPGVWTYSTMPGGGYGYKSGTSMATPHVAGVAALAWSLAPEASYGEIRDGIFAGVDPVPSMSGRTVTGGRLNAFNTLDQFGLLVEDSTPADGEVLTTPPSEFTISFSQPLDPATVDPSDLTVNGIAADSATVTDNTIVFGYITSPVTSQGLQTMAIAGGAVGPNSGGRAVQAWSASFRYDALPMEVVTTVPATGATAVLPLQRIELDLNEPYDATSLASDDLEISAGSVVGVEAVDADSLSFLVEGLTEEGTVTIALAAGALTDIYGNPMLRFDGSFELDVDIYPYPTPLEPKLPPGSLIYDPERRGVIGTAGDRDTFTLSIDAGQKLTVVVTTAQDLQAVVEVAGPDDDDDSVGARAVASSPGQPVVLENVPTHGRLIGNGPGAKTYEIRISGEAGTTGNYAVQVILNAAIEGEQYRDVDNGSLETAQDLDLAFIGLANSVEEEDAGNAARAAVLGRIGGGAPDVIPSSLEDTEGNYGNAFPFHINYRNYPSMRYQQIYAATEFEGGGLIDNLRFRRNANAAPFDTTVIDVQVNIGYAATSVASMSSTFAENIGAGFTTVFDGDLYLESSGTGSPNPFDIVIDVEDTFDYDPSRGDLLVEFRVRNSARTTMFDAMWNKDGSEPIMNRAWAFDANAETGSAWARARWGLVTQFDFVVDEDWYRFTHGSGESSTVALTGLSGGKKLNLDIYDAGGQLLARGIQDAKNVGEFVANLAPNENGGTYYIRVSGSGIDYSLLVTRNADLETGGNDSLDTAQALAAFPAGGRHWVMGQLEPGSQRMFAIPRDGSHTIAELNPVTGAELNRIPTPESTSGLADGVAFDGESLFFINSWSKTPVLWQLDPDTGAVIDSDPIQTGSQRFDGLAALNGNVYISDYLADGIVVYDPAADVIVKMLDIDGLNPGTDLAGGLASLHNPAVLIALDAVGEEVLTIDPETGDVIAKFGTNHTSMYGIAGVGDEIYLGRSFGNYAAVYSRDGEFLRNVSLPFGVSGLTSHRARAMTDFYTVELNDQRTVTVESHTPGGAAGEFANALDPMVRLYNGDGQIVASDDNSSPDHRNGKLEYRIPEGAGGTYYLELLPSDATTETTFGEYILSVKGAEKDSPTFEATVVAPPDGWRTRTVPSQVSIDYNDAILLPSLEASDLSVAGAPAAGVTVQDGNSLAFDIPAHAIHWRSDDGGNGHYYLLPSETMTWVEAEQYAQSLGGHLISINSEREQQFVEHFFLSGENERAIYWIGLTDAEVEGTFRWTSGEPVEYANWNAWEPNDWGTGEDYTTINWHYGSGYGNVPATWNDITGQAARRGIVELSSLPGGVWSVADGVHTFSTPAGGIADVQNTPLREFRTTIELDLTAPQIVAVAPQHHAVVAPGNVDVVVTFSEAMDMASLDLATTTLTGLFRNGSYTATSATWNAAGTALALSYASLPDDRYALTLPSGSAGLKDLVGWQLDGEGTSLPSGNGFQGGDFTVEFAVDPAGAVAYPTPLDAKAPLGSLIYDPSITGTIAFGSDTDDYLLEIDPDQTLTLIVQPEGNLQPTIEIVDASGLVHAIATGSVAGGAAVLQSDVLSGGSYTMRISGVDQSMGLYILQVVLNADVERELHEGDNNSIATAQSLEPSFIPLLKNADRGAVIGKADGKAVGLGPDRFGYMANSIPFEFNDISSTGTEITFAGWPPYSRGYSLLSDAQLGNFEFDFYGTPYKDLYVNTNGMLTFGSAYLNNTNSDLRYTPHLPAIAALWDYIDLRSGGKVYWQVRGGGDNEQLIVQWDNVRAPWWLPSGLTFQAILSEADSSIQFNYLDLKTGYWVYDEGAYATVGIKNGGYQLGSVSDRLLVSYNDWSNEYVGTGKSIRIAVPTPTADYYSVELAAGDKITAVGTPLGGGSIEMELVDGSESLLAAGIPLNTNVGNVISNFEASTSGTYYVRITGDLNADYSLVVTRNAVFDTEGNDTVEGSQDFAGLNVALGHLGGVASTPGHVRIAVHANDGEYWPRNYAQRVANQLNDSTAFDLTATLATNDELDTIEELRAYDVVVLGSYGYPGIPLDVAQALRGWVESGEGGLVSTAFTHRQLAYYSSYTVRAELDSIFPFDLTPASFTYISSPITITVPDHPVTRGIEQIGGWFWGETTYRDVDPGAQVLGTENSWSRPAITVSEESGGRSVHLAPSYAESYTLRVPNSDGDRLLEQAVAWAKRPGIDEADIYHFTATAGETLDLFTVTPADGPGEFVNNLDPRLTLYDGNGNVVATGVATADGRNEQILYTVPDGAGGTYRIAVTAENGTSGEYILDPISVTTSPSVVAEGVASSNADVAVDALAAPLEFASLQKAVAEEPEDPLLEVLVVPSTSTIDGSHTDRDAVLRVIEEEDLLVVPDAEEGDGDEELVDSVFADDAFLHQL